VDCAVTTPEPIIAATRRGDLNPGEYEVVKDRVRLGRLLWMSAAPRREPPASANPVLTDLRSMDSIVITVKGNRIP
jgi:hypothetical protein